MLHERQKRPRDLLSDLRGARHHVHRLDGRKRRGRRRPRAAAIRRSCERSRNGLRGARRLAAPDQAILSPESQADSKGRRQLSPKRLFVRSLSLRLWLRGKAMRRSSKRLQIAAATKNSLLQLVDEVDTVFCANRRWITALPQCRGKGACADNNGGCSHSCISPDNTTVECRCPKGHVLDADERTCISERRATTIESAKYYLKLYCAI